MANKKARILFTSLFYYSLLGMIMSAELTQDEVDKLCEDNPFLDNIIADPSDAHKFIVCADNKGYLITCPTSGFFDASTGKCEATNPNAPPPDVCKNKIMGDRVEDGCQRYYICMQEGIEPIPVACPANQHYSKYEKKCTSPLEAQCMPRQQWCEKKRNGFRLAAAKCFQYYECADEQAALKTCPYNQYFEGHNSTCVPGVCTDLEGNTSEREPNCAEQAEGVKLAHAKCYKFYVCLKNSSYIGQCAAGYYFNAQAGNCIKDVNEVCNDA